MANDFISQVTLPDNQTYDLKDADAARVDHEHGNISSTGTLGSTASYGVATDSNKKIVAINLAVSAPNASGTSTVFVSSVTQSSQGKISVSRANLPIGSDSVTGIVQLGTDAAQAAKGNHEHSAYATTTGSNASGTWPISITGSAATATTSTYTTKDSEGHDIASTYLPIVGGTITGTIASTTITTGALVIKGGIATQADSYLNKSVHIVGSASDNPLIVRGISGSNHLGQIDTTTPTNNGLYLNYNNGPVYLGQPNSGVTSNYTQVLSTLDSTTSTTGALVIFGGVGIAKKVYVNDTVTVKNITITNTAAADHINFTRANYNYINIPADGSLGFSIGGYGADRIYAAISTSAVHCYADNRSSLGKTGVHWSNVYSKKYSIAEQATIQWNSTDSSIDFIFA